ncbi:MAG: laccase domain-containing protein, partial [Actinomycetota bacterium]
MGFFEVRLGAARVVFTDRHGGVSEPPFDTANLGLLTDDDPERVRENRRRAGGAIGWGGTEPVRWLPKRPEHGATGAVAQAGPEGAEPGRDQIELGRPERVVTRVNAGPEHRLHRRLVEAEERVDRG